MPQYRLYFLSSRTGRIERHEEFEASDDDEALDAIDAHRFGDRPIELWSGGRKIGQCDTGLALSGLASDARTATPQSRGAFRF